MGKTWEDKACPLSGCRTKSFAQDLMDAFPGKIMRFECAILTGEGLFACMIFFMSVLTFQVMRFEGAILTREGLFACMSLFMADFTG